MRNEVEGADIYFWKHFSFFICMLFLLKSQKKTRDYNNLGILLYLLQMFTIFKNFGDGVPPQKVVKILHLNALIYF